MSRWHLLACVLALVGLAVACQSSDETTRAATDPVAGERTDLDETADSEQADRDQTAETDQTDLDETAENEQADRDQTAENELTSIVDAAVAEHEGGVDVLIRHEGRPLRLTSGAADDRGTPLAAGAPMRVGSLTKTVVATIVMQLVDEGRVGLDDPLGRHLPEVTVGSEATISQLLAHESGIANYTDTPAFLDEVRADPGRRFTAEQVLGYVAMTRTGPVDTFSYSNTNYILLGLLIEALDGTELSDAISSRITEPLGLESTWLAGSEQPRPVGGWSEGLMAGDPEAEYTAWATSAGAAGALVSSTDDLARFLDALVGGELISDEALAAMTELGPAGNGRGLLLAGLGPGRSGVGHAGAIPGYSAVMAIDPAGGDLLVVLTNNDRLPAERLAASLLAAL